MKGICTAGLVLAIFLVACGDDEAKPGARAQCAAGGELTDCPDADKTPEGVCWRLVECGAISVAGPEDNEGAFDWERCVGFVETRPADRQQLVIDCIAASTCDQLRADGSPTEPDTRQMYCIQVGRDFD